MLKKIPTEIEKKIFFYHNQHLALNKYQYIVAGCCYCILLICIYVKIYLHEIIYKKPERKKNFFQTLKIFPTSFSNKKNFFFLFYSKSFDHKINKAMPAYFS